MLGHQLRMRLDLLKPGVGKKVRAHQEQQKKADDAHSKPKELQPGAKVYARNFGQGVPWLPVVVQESKGSVSYTVELENGRVFRRYVDHLRVCTAMIEPPAKVDEYLPFGSHIPLGRDISYLYQFRIFLTWDVEIKIAMDT